MRNKNYIKKSFYKISGLLITAFSTAFYSRIVCSVTRLPSVLNHLHFAVPLMTAMILTTARPKDPKQISIVWMLLSGLLTLLGVMTTSALINHAGIINVIFDFLILERFQTLVTSTKPQSLSYSIPSVELDIK